MTRLLTKPRRLTVTIREERVSGFAPLPQGRPRLDRESGVIYGVKVVGRSSPNTHGVHGVDGTDYTEEALRGEARMLEGINCNVDHPPRGNPNQERSAKDRFAWLENIEVRESGLYGELHFLDPTDPLAVKMMNAAESKPDAFALSHNAIGRGEVRNRRYVIHEVTEVRSVDIVADGGTNRSLFEGRKMKSKVHDVLKKHVLPALQAGRKKRLQRLLETSLTEARSPLMEADEDSKDHRDHMYGAMRACEEAGNEDGARGIHKLLDPSKRLEEEEEEETKEKDEEEEGGERDEDKEEGEVEEGMGEEGPGEGGSSNEGPDGKGGKGTAWESRRHKKQRPGEVRLTESRALAMCQAAGVEATADVMEAIQGADFDQAMRVIKLAKRSQHRPGSIPRSGAPGRGADSGALIPKNLKDWAESLKG